MKDFNEMTKGEIFAILYMHDKYKDMKKKNNFNEDDLYKGDYIKELQKYTKENITFRIDHPIRYKIRNIIKKIKR